MIVLADVGTLSPEIRERISAWVEQGGVLVRFAGRAWRRRMTTWCRKTAPRRAQPWRQPDLEKPQHLASFAADGPVCRSCRAQGHHRQPAGPRRAGRRAGDEKLGLAGRCTPL